MTEILNGNVLAKNIREKAAQRIAKLPHPPGLAVLLVGDNAASHLYVSLKEKAAKEVGIYIEKFLFAADVTTQELVDKITELNGRKDIHGVLVQLPLPGDQDTNAVVAAIDPNKDVDGFHPENRKALAADTPLLVPPVALAVMRMLQASRAPLAGKHAVIVGNSAIFSEPIVDLMREAGVLATFVESDASALAAKTRVADIIIIAVGQAGFLTRDMVKQGAIVIDVGTNKTADGRVVGDSAPDLDGHAGFMSRVPGGVGPLTVAYLLFNVIKAMEVQKG
ncbi:MAG: bifunctional 5,10-methylenetetrahydrofolate dehydrogenase/5,10-methenyltetrahydrofolate cyclohydrolase [Patescibacteria group bacterium]